jgi:hypothetical protein
MATRAARVAPLATHATWPELQRSDEFRGLWVALDNCRYDARTAQPVEGSVVDSDEDLAELCSRIRSEDGRHCAIVFCGATTETENVPSMPPDSQRSSSPSYPPHVLTH